MFTRVTTNIQERPSGVSWLGKQPLKVLFIGIMFFCTLTLSYSFWVQKNLNLIPCKFCVFQQLSYVLIALISFLGLLGNQKRVLLLLRGVLILAAAIAGYHTLIQFGLIQDPCIQHTPISVEQFESILIQSLDKPLQATCSNKLASLFGLPFSIYNFVIFLTLFSSSYFFSTHPIVARADLEKHKTSLDS